MHRSLFALTAVALLFAGCVAPKQAEPLEPGAQEDARVQEPRPEPYFANITEVNLTPPAPPDLTATLAAPPQLKAGEWWRIRVEHTWADVSAEFVRVVGAVEEDQYIIGMPHEGWFVEAIMFHAPGLGEVARDDLSYLVHDVPFQPLKFPLENGTTWTTSYPGAPEMTAHVEVLDESRARVTFTGPTQLLFAPPGLPTPSETIMELVYDASVHDIVEFKHYSLSYEVIEHGYDYQGWVTIPSAQHVALYNVRVGPALTETATPAPPIETTTIKGGLNRMGLMVVAEGFAGAACRERATSPDGTEFVSELAACYGANVLIAEAKNPVGEWTFEHIAAGGGVVYTEGIGYTQYDIRLPDGAIRTEPPPGSSGMRDD